MEREILVAVDLGNSRIRMMAAERQADNRLKVLWMESRETEDESVQNGIIKKPADVADMLRNAAEQIENRLGNKYAIDGFYLGINGRSLRTVRGRVNRTYSAATEITAEELVALKKELSTKPIENREIFDITGVGFVADGDRVRNPKGRVCRRIEANYLIACANSDLRDNIDKCMERLGLEIMGEKLAPVAIADAVLTADDKNAGCVEINFGAATTTVAVYHGGNMNHIAVVPFGGKHITADIMSLDMDFKTAEKIKTQYAKQALKNDDSENGKMLIIKDNYGNEHKVSIQSVVELIKARLSEIVGLCMGEIEHSLKRSDLKAGIVVTGGVTNMENFENFVAEKTGMLVRKGSHTHLLTDESVANYSKSELALLAGLLADADKQCVSPKNIQPEPESGNEPETTQPAEPEKEKKSEKKERKQETENKPKPNKKGRGWKNFSGFVDNLFGDREDTIED